MPGPSVLDDIELLIEDIRGGGSGKPPSRHGDDGDDGQSRGGGGSPEPSGSSARKYSTAMALAMLSILMFFMVLTAAFVVLRVNNLHRWSGIRIPWILWINTFVLVASSATLELAKRSLQMGSLGGFRKLWALTTALGAIFIGGQLIGWFQVGGTGGFLILRLSRTCFF